MALIIGPAIALGLIIGAYEAIIIHRDVRVPTHRMGHMMHALILSIVFVLVAMNTQYVIDMGLGGIPVLGNVHIVRVLVGLIAAIKIHGTSRAVKGAGAGVGMGETWFHSILIGALIAASPYIYPIVEPMIPGFMKF